MYCPFGSFSFLFDVALLLLLFLIMGLVLVEVVLVVMLFLLGSSVVAGIEVCFGEDEDETKGFNSSAVTIFLFSRVKCLLFSSKLEIIWGPDQGVVFCFLKFRLYTKTESPIANAYSGTVFLSYIFFYIWIQSIFISMSCKTNIQLLTYCCCECAICCFVFASCSLCESR